MIIRSCTFVLATNNQILPNFMNIVKYKSCCFYDRSDFAEKNRPFNIFDFCKSEGRSKQEM